MLSRENSLSPIQELREPDAQKEWKGDCYAHFTDEEIEAESSSDWSKLLATETGM